MKRVSKRILIAGVAVVCGVVSVWFIVLVYERILIACYISRLERAVATGGASLLGKTMDRLRAVGPDCVPQLLDLAERSRELTIREREVLLRAIKTIVVDMGGPAVGHVLCRIDGSSSEAEEILSFVYRVHYWSAPLEMDANTETILRHLAAREENNEIREAALKALKRVIDNAN